MAIIPVFTRPPLLPGERPLFALTAEDYGKVRDGYGCPECLEDFQGVYMLKCPVCQHVRQEGEVAAVPPGWEQHLRDRESGYAPPVAGNPLGVDEFIADVLKDPDIEQRRV